MKKIAFTLAEVMLAMSIIGVLAVVSFKAMNTKNIDEQTKKAKAHQALAAIEQAASNIISQEDTKCPAKAFMVKVAGTYEYATYKANGTTLAATSDVVSMFSEYMKTEKTNLNFCTYSNYCASSNTSIKGFRIAGDVYIGIKVFGDTAIADCPTTYYMPDSAQAITVTAAKAGKCWGELYVDVDGTKGKGVLGDDVYKWGLGEMGVVH